VNLLAAKPIATRCANAEQSFMAEAKPTVRIIDVDPDVRRALQISALIPTG
jgi:hypothetical protein